MRGSDEGGLRYRTRTPSSKWADPGEVLLLAVKRILAISAVNSPLAITWRTPWWWSIAGLCGVLSCRKIDAKVRGAANALNAAFPTDRWPTSSTSSVTPYIELKNNLLYLILYLRLLTSDLYLRPHSQNRLDSVANSLIPWCVLEPQKLTRSAVVEAIDRRRQVAGSILRGQFQFQLRMSLSDSVCHIFVREVTGSHEESLPTGFGHFDGLDVSQGYITDIDVEEGTCGRQLVLEVTLDEVLHALVGCVNGFERVEVMHNRSEDKGRVDRGDVEVGLLVFNEVPSSLFCEGLLQVSIVNPGLLQDRESLALLAL